MFLFLFAFYFNISQLFQAIAQPSSFVNIETESQHIRTKKKQLFPQDYTTTEQRKKNPEKICMKHSPRNAFISLSLCYRSRMLSWYSCIKMDFTESKNDKFCTNRELSQRLDFIGIAFVSRDSQSANGHNYKNRASFMKFLVIKWRNASPSSLT